MFRDGGAEAIVRLTNFSSRELSILWTSEVQVYHLRCEELLPLQSTLILIMALAPKKQLPSWSYIIVDLGLQPDVLLALRQQALKASYNPIFVEVGGEEDDAFCAQARVDQVSGALAKLKAALLYVTACFDAD
jgi:hypothetical protein